MKCYVWLECKLECKWVQGKNNLATKKSKNQKKEKTKLNKAKNIFKKQNQNKTTKLLN
jgi:hypothetical protein